MPESAQRQLDALRADLEIRLAALEVALDDPAQSHTLPRLILDLTRIATTEAEATAARACAGLKLEADMQMAQVRAAAQSAVEQAGNVASELRRSLEQALQRITTLERDKQTHADALRDAVDAAVADQRAAVLTAEGLASRLERDLARERAALESERAARAELRASLDRTEADARTLKADAARTLAEHSTASAALAAERQTLSATHRAHEETKAALAAAQSTIGELRYTLDETKKSADIIDLERSRTRNDHEALKQAHADLQRRAAKLEKAAADADARTAAERRLADQQRTAADAAANRATAVTGELDQMRQARDRAAADLSAAQIRVAELERTVTTTEGRLLLEERTIAELRAAVDTADSRSQSLDAEQTKTRALHERLTADLAAVRQRVAELEQSLAGAESRLLAEQRTVSELRAAAQAADNRTQATGAEQIEAREQLSSELTSARQRIAGLEQSLAQADARIAAEQAAAAIARAEANLKAQAPARDASVEAPHKDLEAARGRIVLLERALADTESQLKDERKALTQMRDGLGEGREGIIGRLIYEQTERRTEQTKMAAAIDQERERANGLERACAEHTAAIEAERAESARLRKVIEQAQSDVAQVAVERDRGQEEREQIRQELTAARAHGEALEADLRASQRRIDELSASLERASHASADAGTESADHDPRTMARRSARFRSRPAFDTQGNPEDGTEEIDDSRPTRLSIRYRFREPIEIQVNGKGAILRDLSKGGCQLLSASALRPNQNVKLAIPGDDEPIACTGRVVWAQLQPASQGALCYRTGIQFTDADEAAVEAFATEYGTPD